MTRAVEANQEAFDPAHDGRPGAGRRPAGRRGGPGHDRRDDPDLGRPAALERLLRRPAPGRRCYAAVYEGLAADPEDAEAAPGRARSGWPPATTTAASARWPASTPPPCRCSWWRTPATATAASATSTRASPASASTTACYDDDVAARPALPGAASLAPLLQRGPAALRRHPARPDHPPGAPHGRRAAQPQHRRDDCCSPGSSLGPLLELGLRRPATTRRAHGAAPSCARATTSSCACSMAAAKATGRRRRTASTARAWSPR